MKNVFIVLAVLVLSRVSFSQESEARIYSCCDDFDPLPTAYLFGDKEKLRTELISNAEVIAFLFIRTKIEILEKTDKIIVFNGLESFWYKVKVGNLQGFL